MSILFGAIDKIIPNFAIFKSNVIRFCYKSTRVCPEIEGNIPKMSDLKSQKRRKSGVFIGIMCILFSIFGVRLVYFWVRYRI